MYLFELKNRNMHKSTQNKVLLDKTFSVLLKIFNVTETYLFVNFTSLHKNELILYCQLQIFSQFQQVNLTFFQQIESDISTIKTQTVHHQN